MPPACLAICYMTCTIAHTIDLLKPLYREFIQGTCVEQRCDKLCFNQHVLMHFWQASLSAMTEVVAQAFFHEGTQQLASGQTSEAAHSFQRAISLGHAESHAALAFMHYGTYKGMPSSPDTIFQLASAGFSLGCIHSKGALADCLLNGTGTARDEVGGFRLATESAEAGSLYGQHSLAVAYRTGVAGVPRDPAKAALLFTLAAEQGEVHSLDWLGNMYRPQAPSMQPCVTFISQAIL